MKSNKLEAQPGKTILRLGVLICSLFAVVSLTAQATLAPDLRNGSFDLPVLPPGSEVPSVAFPWEIGTGTPTLVTPDVEPANNTGRAWLRSPDGGNFAKVSGTFDPAFKQSVKQTVSGFVIGQTYELQFYATNTGFYFPIIDEWNATPGYLEVYLDDALIHESSVVAAPTSEDELISWSAESVRFVATAETHVIRIGGATTSPVGSSPSRNTTAYMAADGVRLTSEICNNGIDDDFDGLVDDLDQDCKLGVGMLVRCLHTPLWPNDGDLVTIHAETIDSNGDAVIADRIEIYTSDPENPEGGAGNNIDAQISTVATGRSLRYSCYAERGEETAFSGWREADVGTPEFDEFRAVPVVYNGPIKEKIDILFIPEAGRHGVGAGAQERFNDDIFQVILEGIYGVPWFVRNQTEVNFWLGRDMGNVTPSNPDDPTKKCKKDKPAGFKKDYGFVDAAGIIHTEPCRDNASLKVFTTALNARGLQVVSHEIGHAAFSLSDEYEGAPTLYFTLPDFPNLLPTSGRCRSAAEDRGFNAGDCRPLSDASGFSIGGFWIFEPSYRAVTPEIPDLMQQAGEAACDAGTCEQYDVGPSETSRMSWKLGKCRAGKC